MADPLDPVVVPFFGCRAHERAHEELAPGDPCGNCGAVYDARGRVLTVPTPPDVAAATGCVAVATGVHAGDDWLVCGRCLCLSPANRARVAAGTRPRPRRDTKADRLRGARPAPRLTARERSGLVADAPAGLKPLARAWLAMQDARAAGDDARAAALASLIGDAPAMDARAFSRAVRAILGGGSDGA